METVNDIIKEMHEVARMYLAGGNESASVYEMLSSYADHLESAYKRDMKAIVDTNEVAMQTAMDEVEKLRAALYSDGDFGKLFKERDMGIERLRAAPKPIIDFRPEICGDYGEEEAWDSDRMMEAMVKAREIYNGGAK